MGREWHGKQILDNSKSIHDPLSGCIDKETAAYKKAVLESQIEKEKTADLQELIDDNKKINGERYYMLNNFYIFFDLLYL